MAVNISYNTILSSSQMYQKTLERGIVAMVHSVRMHIKMPYRENICLIFRNTEGDSQAWLSVWLCGV